MNIFVNSSEDPTLIQDERVVTNMMKGEDSFVVCGEKLEEVWKAGDIHPRMRQTLIQWIHEVCCATSRDRHVFFYAVNYIDRFMAGNREPIGANKLQTLGSACLFIASKMLDVEALTCWQIVEYTDHSISTVELTQTEEEVLDVLEWVTSITSPMDFMEHVVARLDLKPTNKRHMLAETEVMMGKCALKFDYSTELASEKARDCLHKYLNSMVNEKDHSSVIIKRARAILPKVLTKVDNILAFPMKTRT